MRERQTDRDRETEIDRDTERQTDRDRKRESERGRRTERERKSETETETETERDRDRETSDLRSHFPSFRWKPFLHTHSKLPGMLLQADISGHVTLPLVHSSISANKVQLLFLLLLHHHHPPPCTPLTSPPL